MRKLENKNSDVSQHDKKKENEQLKNDGEREIKKEHKHSKHDKKKRNNVIFKCAQQIFKMFNEYRNTKSPSYIFHKEKEYKKKYNMSNSEFEDFIETINFMLKNGTEKFLDNSNHSKLNKLFGKPFDRSIKKIEFDNVEDYDVFKEIIELNKKFSFIHQSVKKLTSTYICDYDTLFNHTSNSKNLETNFHTSIHTVLLALFIPNFNNFNQYIINSSIANILANRYNGRNIMTRGDLILLRSLVTDM